MTELTWRDLLLVFTASHMQNGPAVQLRGVCAQVKQDLLMNDEY